MIPVELRRNIHAQLVVAHPADVIKQVIIGRKAETRTAVKTVTFIAIFAVITGHILELRTNTAAYGEVETA
ncbi:hypothetical protein D3C71_2040320 [compost metagenome]